MRQPSSLPRWALVGAFAIMGCGSNASAPESDAGFIYLDGGEDGPEDGAQDLAQDGTDDGADAPAATDGRGVDLPTSCAAVLTVVTASAGCRTDWACPGVGLYTFVCNGADGGAPMCYCVAPDGPQTSGAIDACTGGESGVHAAAASLCGWPFAGNSATDGGGQ